jgi:hypothetical protein
MITMTFIGVFLLLIGGRDMAVWPGCQSTFWGAKPFGVPPGWQKAAPELSRVKIFSP